MKRKIDLSKLKNFNFSLKKFSTLKWTKKMRLNSSLLSLSKRDFVLLTLLLLGLEGYGLYQYLLSPQWQKYSDLHKRYTEEQTIAENFEKDMAQKTRYYESLNMENYRLSNLIREIPSQILQEEIVLTLNKLAQTSQLDINGISLSNISAVSRQDFIAGKIPAQSKDAGKANTPANVNKNIKESSQGTAATNSTAGKTAKAETKPANNMVLVEDVEIAFSGSYGALYNFISNLEQGERKIIIKEVSMNRENGGQLKGTLKVQYVGYTFPEEEIINALNIPPVSGKTSPFTEYPGYADQAAATAASGSAAGSSIGPAPVKTYNPDFYILLNTFDDNAPKIIMGDSSRDGTEIYDNTNANEKGKLVISGDQDNMTYSYSLGGLTRTKNTGLALEEGKLRLEVSSLPRKGTQDKVGLTLDVENKTGYPLEITVLNDDKAAPRFSLGSRVGSVTVK